MAIILSAILYPIAIATSLAKNFWKTKFGEGIRKMNRQLLEIATSIDANGNVVCDDLFNQILIKKDGYQFGNRRETVSSALGKNQIKMTLTWMGSSLVWILDKIEKDHCLKSIDQNV